MVGAVATGGAVGAVVGVGGGTVDGGVVAGARTAVVGGTGGVVMVCAAGAGVMAVEWEFDMRPSPRARPPATRAAITAVMIPSRLVT